MSQENLRKKKGLTPLGSRQTIISGFRLSFPKGAGIDFVEPAFATLKRDPEGKVFWPFETFIQPSTSLCHIWIIHVCRYSYVCLHAFDVITKRNSYVICPKQVHGVSTLLSIEDAVSLDRQEGITGNTGSGRGYTLASCDALTYDGDSLQVEVYAPTRKRPDDHPEGTCSARYRDLLVRGAQENDLAASWIEKLKRLPIYTPSKATLLVRVKSIYCNIDTAVPGLLHPRTMPLHPQLNTY